MPSRSGPVFKAKRKPGHPRWCYLRREDAEQLRGELNRDQAADQQCQPRLRIRLRPCWCGGYYVAGETRHASRLRADWGGMLVTDVSAASVAAALTEKQALAREGDEVLQVTLFYADTFDGETWAVDHARLSAHRAGAGIARSGDHYDAWLTLPIAEPEIAAAALLGQARQWSLENMAMPEAGLHG